jgi:hypothetical protein
VSFIYGKIFTCFLNNFFVHFLHFLCKPILGQVSPLPNQPLLGV